MVIHESDNYIVQVEQLPEDKLQQYVVRNKQFGVVEYADNTYVRVIQWVDECERVTKEYFSNRNSPKPEPFIKQTLN